MGMHPCVFVSLCLCGLVALWPCGLVSLCLCGPNSLSATRLCGPISLSALHLWPIRPSPDKFSDFKPATTKIDQQPMSPMCRTQITQDLCDTFVSKSFACFQFNDQCIFHNHVGYVFSQDASILIAHQEPPLRLHQKSSLAQSVHQSILINTLQVAITQVAIKCKCMLPDMVTELAHIIFWPGDWMFSVVFHGARSPPIWWLQRTCQGRKEENFRTVLPT